MADFGGDTELEAFRAEAAAWLKANFPASLKGKAHLANAEGVGPAGGDFAAWKKAIGEKGWGTPTWPREYGGGGLSVAQARVLGQEMAKAGAFNPLTFGMGVTMIGPTILDYGTEEQKRTHIPPIVKGEVRWCVGYSEPNAGSDLASLQTKCEDKGEDGWLINGSKIWTSGAQWSDWCGCLVRTDPSAKKHEGISFILLNMRQEGVETRPIPLIAGDSPFCETFFTDATAPKEALLGKLNEGWTVGKRLLQHERASQTGAAFGGRQVALQDVAKKYVETDEAGRIADPDLRTRLTRHLMDSRVHNLTLARAAAEAKNSNSPGNAASVLKNSATAVAQTRAELTLEIMGAQGLGWGGESFAPEEIEAVRGWLFGKAMSIYGGSSEIQNNIISKRILGLPDTTQSS
jgi:alkylation response protein AidB-like acyl-CoA dehydrogenase